jgi:DNA repair protein RadC
MSYLTPDQMSNGELVAAVLGKKALDDECLRLGQCIAHDGDFTDMLYFNSNSARQAKLAKIQAAVELGRRMLMTQRFKDVKTVSTPEEVVALMEPIYAGMDKEVFYCLCLNTKNHLIKMVQVSVGSLNSSIVHPRELYKEAVRVSAASIIIVHNHPSGDITPSGADIQLTRRLARAGEVMGIELLDHIVMGGEGRHSSLRDQGVL